MKVLFLDIDGVLIRFGDTKQIKETRSLKGDRGGLITSLDEDLVFNLIEIIKETKARIVISSSWRRNLMDKLRDEFYRIGDMYGFDLWHWVISKTPHSLNHGRGNEILTWITNYHENCGGGNHVEKWVVIDDDNFDMKCISRLGKLVHTKTSEGLTKEKAQECIEKLKDK